MSDIEHPFLRTSKAAARPPAPRAAYRVARKEYPCEIGCGHVIEKGETYRLSAMRMCCSCYDERYGHG